MTQPSRTRSLGELVGTRLLASGVALAVCAAVVAAMLLLQQGSPATASDAQVSATLAASTGDDTPENSTDAQREKLAADLKAARALEGDERKAALTKVRAAAQDGEYGPGVQRRAERRDDRALVWAALPKELRTDLKKIRSADADDRAGLRDDLRKKALAGDYGDRVQKAAKKLQERRADS